MLGCLKIRWPALHILADVFQGCYKNRTDGTNDYRYFAAFYFILHIIVLLVNVLNHVIGLGWTLSTAVLIIGSLLFALLRPYKKNWLKHSWLCNTSITGSWNTVDTLQFRDTNKVDWADRIYCSTTTDVLCYVCSIQAPFMVKNISEMSATVKNHLPVPATKVARS